MSFVFIYMSSKSKALHKKKGLDKDVLEHNMKVADKNYAKGKRHYLPATHSDTQFNKQKKYL